MKMFKEDEPYEPAMARAEGRLATLMWLREYHHEGWRHPKTGETMTLTEFLDAAIEDANESIAYMRGG